MSALALPTPNLGPGLPRARTLLVVLLFVLALCSAALAFQSIAAGTLPGGTSYSETQVAGFFANSSNPYLAANASSFAAMSHNVEDPNGNTGTYNGSCCSGLMQMNQGNLKTYCNCTPQQFAQMSGQDQVNIYTNYFNDVQKDSSAKTLMNMQANGQTLGGQPITGATIAACAQMGTGNCRAAIANNCSSIARGQGGDNYVNVCTMAAKANAGTQVANPGATDPQKPAQNPATPDQAKTNPNQTTPPSTPSNPSFNGSVDQPMNPGIGFTPQQLGANGSMMAIGDPTVCWVCDAVIHTMGVSEALVKNGATTVLNELWPLVVAVFMLSLGYAILRALVQGGNPFSVALPMVARFAVVAALAGGVTATVGAGAVSGSTSSTGTTMGSVSTLSMNDTGGGDQGNAVTITPADGATGNGSLSSANYATDLFLEPPVDLGAGIGADLGTATSSAIGITLNPGNCKHDDVGSSGISILATSANALVNLACEVHAFASTGIDLGGVIVTHPARDSATSDQMIAIVVAGVGLLVMFMSFQALLGFGFALVECIVVSAIVACFLPIMIMSYAFESTRGMLRHAWDNMLFVTIYLAMSGVGGVVMVFVLVKGMALGLGQPTLSDPQAIVTAFDGMYAGNDVTSPATFSAVLKFVCFTSAGALLAGRIMQGVHHVAAEVSNHALAQQAGLAKAGLAMVQRTVTMGVSLAGAGGGIGLHVAGGMAGKLAGGLGGALTKGAVRQAGARLVRPPGR